MKTRSYALFYVLLCFFLIGAVACDDRVDSEMEQSLAASDVHIGAASALFIPHQMTTRGDAYNTPEQQIHQLHFFVFDQSGAYLASEDPFSEQSHQINNGGSFNLLRQCFVDQTAAKTARVCIVANGPADLLTRAKIKNYSDLQQVIFPHSGVSLPASGLVLYGEQVLDLSHKTEGVNFQIPVKSLMARVDIRVRNIPEFVNDGLPMFQLTHYDLVNLPEGTLLQEAPETIGKKVGQYTLSNQSFAGNSYLRPGEQLDFSFYMGEHKCLAKSSQGVYPDNIPESAKQRFKPQLAKPEAMYVVLYGLYTDVHGKTYHIAHTLYLGANHTDDFQLKRNHQYKVQVDVRGIKVHDDMGKNTISYDMRVDVSNEDFLIQTRRETMLDSHFETRPMDVYLASPDSKVEIEILDPTGANNWFRLDKSSTQREYFTSDLISKTLKRSVKHTITGKSKERIWLYFDETNMISTGGMREGNMAVRYYKHAADKTPEQVITYSFFQRDLFPVKYSDREYLIEYYEEYLHDFDPDNLYGQTTDGMAWGMDGVQLSDTHEAFESEGDFWSDVVEYIIRNLKPFYDFDETRQGSAYTQKIINKTNATQLTLQQKPRHAVEYCYNKNKRNAEGSVETLNWYMPAIGEIEDICSGGYTSFDVFQDKYYWGSQPAYQMNNYEIHSLIKPSSGIYREDHTTYARATKVAYQDGQYNTVHSDATGCLRLMHIYPGLGLFPSVDYDEINKQVTGPGYQLRTTINRVRAVRINNGDLIYREETK